jgi:membrane protein implicated in regulation of membrane protease activity
MRLDPASHLVEIARGKKDQQMSQPSSPPPRRIVWQSVITVLSAAVLISAEVFGAAFAGGWALASLAGLSEYAVYAQGIFFLVGVAVMVAFVRNGMRVEPFTTTT